MKRFKKSNKNFIFILILLSFAVGYALISGNINITGLAGVNKNTWDIHWDRTSLEVSNKSVSQELPIISEDNKTITYNVNFKKPGDFYEFTVDAKNYGTLDGMVGINDLSPVVKNSSDEVISLPKYLKYTITYSDNQPIRQYELLKSGQSEKIKVRIEFDAEVAEEDLPDGDDDVTIGTEIPYKQTDDNAHERDQITTYKITFNPNGGSVSPTTKDINIGDSLGELPTPTRSGYRFLGWYTGETDGIQVTTNTIPSSNETYYAHWEELIAYLDTGINVNMKMKHLAGTEMSAEDYGTIGTLTQKVNSTVTSIEKSLTPPNLNNMSNENIISISSSEVPVYTWHENGTLYYYSEANKIYTNEDASYMFAAYDHLTNLDVSGLNTSNTTNMTAMFAIIYDTLAAEEFNSQVESEPGVYNITEEKLELYNSLIKLDIDLSNFDTSNVTNMSGMFAYTAGYKNINLSSFDTRNVTDMSGMFAFTEDINGINFSYLNTSNVTNMSSMFAVYFGNNDLDLSSFDTKNVTDMSGMFWSSMGLKAVNLSSFDTSKVTNMSTMFFGCNLLKTLNLSNFNTSNVTNMSYMFGGCSALENINLSSFDTKKVTNMSGMFDTCDNLETLNLSNFNTSNVEDMSTMFRGCDNLIELDLSSFDTHNTLRMNEMFGASVNLKTIYASENFVVDQTTNSNNMFSHCISLVGGMGTLYDNNHIDKTYAHIDGGTSNPGYFTKKGVYYVTFNGNGGIVSPSIKEITIGQPIGELPTPTREHYTFVGWYTDITDGTQINDSYIPTAYTVLYAHWTENTKYTITLNPNEGTVSPTSLEVYDGEQIGELPTPERSGYVFDGWYSEITDGEEITSSYIPNSNKTIYARWHLSSYTITFNPNGGSVSPTTKDVNIGDALGDLPTPTRANYTFDGWHIDVSDYIDIDSSYIPSGNMTLYAKWYPNDKVAEINGTYYNTLQLAVNAVPTTGEETTIRLLKNTTEKVTIAEGKNIVLNLRGFTVNNTSSNTMVNGGTLKMYNGYITCSAGSGAIDVTGTLELNNVTIEATGSRQALYNNGGTVTIRNSDLSSVATQRATLHNLNNGTVTIESGNIISTNLYAVYNEKGTINIGIKDGKTNIAKPMIQGKTYGIVANNKYNFYDGIIKGGTYATGTATTGSTPTVAIDTNETKINEIETDSEKVRGEEEIGGTTYKTLYLHNTKTITITFDPNQGIVNPSSKTLNEGEAIGELPTPVRTGYNFVGWYTELSGGTQITTEYIPTENKTIYARWEEKSTNTVVFNPNGGTVYPTEKEINPNEQIGELPTPVREGYKFLGWYTELNSGVKIETSYIPTTKVTTLYARWNNFPTVFKQEGACEFNGSGNITGSECTKYADKKYIDTGIALYSLENYQKDYEIGFTIENYDPSNNNPKQATFVNAKLEDSSISWPGLVYRREGETDNLEITQTINGTKESKSTSKNNVTSVKIVRINGVVYYSYNEGELQELQDTSGFNQQFSLTTWFGAAPGNASGTSAQRYLNATLSNMYIKLGTYEEEGNYIITFDPNEGQVSSTKKKISQGAPIGDLPTPTREHYRFDGWYTGLTDGTKITEATIPEDNVTYYAHWVEDQYYNITFNADEGQVEEPTRKVYVGEKLGNLPVPSKPGYEFMGWYTGLTDGVEITSETIPENDTTYYAHWILLVDKTFTYNANNGNFDGSETLNTIKYEYRNGVSTKYSHTPNINNNGVANGNYDNNLSINDIVTIPGSSSLNIEVWYSTESDIFDWLAIYPEGITPTASNFDQATISNGKLGGGASETKPSDNSEYHKTFTVNGDTAQFYFVSDSSSNYYGYYAIVTGECLNYYGNKDYKKPTRNSYVFTGWNTERDGSGTSYADENEIRDNISKINDNTVFYAQWREEITEFDVGSAVNIKMRELSGNSGSYVNWDNTTINQIVRSTTPPTENNKKKENLISSVNSDKPIYAWNSNGTIYWWAEVEKPKLNSDSSHMFRNLEGLTSIDVSDFDTSNVTNMSYMFSECRSLTQLDLSSFDTRNVTDMSYMFKMEEKNLGGGYTQLQTLNVSSFNTSKVTNMHYMFSYCEELQSLNLSSFDTSNVTDMTDLFKYCRSLETLNISNFNTSKVTTIGWMFYECNSLRSLNVSSFDTSKIRYMSLMFYRCSSLTSLDLSNFNTSNVIDMYGMFEDCSSLTSLDLNGFNTSNVENMGSMFRHCQSLQTIDLSMFDTTNNTRMEWMFEGCSSLTSIDLSNFDVSGVGSFNNLFKDCSSLTTLDLSNFNTSNSTKMNSMFEGCSNLTTIYASNSFVTTNVETSSNMFTGDTKIVGGNGTTYDSNKIDKEYARIDTASTPGYFTLKDGWVLINRGTLGNPADHLLDQKWSYYDNGVRKENGFYLLDDLYEVEQKYFFANGIAQLGWLHYDGYYYYLSTEDDDGNGYVNAGAYRSTTKTIDGVSYEFDSEGRCINYNSTSFNTVILNPNGGEVSPNIINVNTNSSIGTLPTPVRYGYVFEGWYTGLFDGIKVDSTYTPTSDVTLYARWTVSGKYLITFNPNGGEIYQHEKIIKIGSSIGQFPAQPTREGYVFDGWWTLPQDGIEVTEQTIPTGNITYYAHWTKLPTYTIHFNAGDGTPIDDIEVIQGRSIGELPISTQNGYLLEGWYTLPQDGIKITEETIPTGEVTYYAHWIEATATFDTGTNVNVKFKKLAGNSNASSYTKDTNIISIQKSNVEPTSENKTTEHIVSSTTSTVPIYAWFNNGTIYWWTNTNSIYLNENSSSLFTGLNSVTSIDTSFDTSKVTNMSSMFWDCINLTSLDLSSFNTNKVTTLYYMFGNCSNLQTLNLSSFNTQNVTSMSYMFYNCSGLTSLDVSKFNTQNVTDMFLMFYNCSGLTSLDVSKFNTQNVTDMHWMFCNCSGLTSLDVSKFNTQNVTNMSLMFGDCSGLTSLDVSKFNTQNVTSMSLMFSNCSGLTSLDVSKFNTSKVTNIHGMFMDCSGLTSLDVSKFNTQNVTNMSSMFSNCSGLTSLDVSNFNTSKVTDMSGMFNGCSGLTSLDLSSFDTKNITSMSLMFKNCSSLTNLDVSNFNTSKVTKMEATFYGCTNLITLNISNLDMSKVGNIGSRTIDDISYTLAGTDSLKTIIADNTTYSNESIKIYMSYYEGPSKTLETLSLRNSSVGSATSLESMLYNYEKLTFVDFTNFDTTNITDMSYMFFGCESLPSLDISSFDTSEVTNMSEMFSYCWSLTSLDLSNFNTSNVTNMEQMFFDSHNLNTIYASNTFVTNNVTDSMWMFADCTSIVGGAGTTYNARKDNKTYARIDTSSQPGYFTLKDEWVLINRGSIGNPATHLLEQQWSYYDNGVRKENGFYLLDDLYGLEQKYFFANGIAQLGWIHYDGYYYYLSTEDDDGNGYVNAGAYRSTTKTIDGVSYDFDSEGRCTNYNGTSFNTVVFNANGGEVTPNSKNINANSTIGTLPTPTRNGYTFLGWYTGLFDGVQVDSTYTPTTNVMLYAKWRNSATQNVDFATSPWDDIINTYNSGDISNLIQAMEDGTTRPILLDMDNDGIPETTANLRISNLSTPAECSTQGFSQTACGLVLEFADVITKHRMNPSSSGNANGEGNYGGWEYSEIRNYLKSTVYNALPPELKSRIIDTPVVSGHGSSQSNNFYTTDKLYLLSTKEIWGKEGTSNVINYDSAEAETRQLDYYKAKGVTTSNYSEAIKQYNGSNYDWWLRSASSDMPNRFFEVASSGAWSGSFVTGTSGVSPAFRIG